jgi:Ulp1 family protease
MASPNGRLNDDCINGISQLLLHVFSDPANPHSMSSARCALFSTHDLLLVRYSAADDDIWRHTHGTQFWDKDVWILPIHRRLSEHWVLVVICPSTRQIFCFDSFAEVHPWKREVKVNTHSNLVMI